MKDLHGRYILGNETLVRTLGLRELDDVIGKTDREVLPHDVELVTGADREVMATGRAKQYEQTLHLPGGTRTLLATKSPLKDEDGNTLGVIVIGTDITDRKLVEEELRVERDRHAAFLAAMQDGLFATDLAARLTQANARFCEIVGYTPEEVIGVLPPYPWWPAPSDPEFARAITAVEHVIDGGHGEFDTAIRHRDGHQVPVILNVASLRDAQGNVVGYVGTMKEVTERKQADEARGRLFAAEAKARRRADRASKRARALAAAALARASTPAEVAVIILEHALGSLEAQGAGMAVPDPTGAYLELVATARLTGEVYAHQVRLPIDGPYAPCEAFRSGRPVRIASRAEWEQRYAVGAEIFAGKADAVVTLPLIGTVGPIGAIGLLFEHERTFTDDELATLGTFAQQGAQALERAGLYELEHEARARVERLQRVTALLSASLTSSQIADVVIEEALAAVGANAGVVALMSEDGARFDTVRAVGPAVEALRFVPSFPANARSPIADAVRWRRPVILRSYDEGETKYPEFPWPHAADREGALVALPMVGGATCAGRARIGFPTEPGPLGRGRCAAGSARRPVRAGARARAPVRGAARGRRHLAAQPASPRDPLGRPAADLGALPLRDAGSRDRRRLVRGRGAPVRTARHRGRRRGGPGAGGCPPPWGGSEARSARWRSPAPARSRS